jgi:hypothetical protein
MMKLTDEQILAKHSQSVRPRARMELKIVNRIIAEAKAKGYTLKVWDGYEEEGNTDYDVKTAIFDLDSARVEVFNGDKQWIGNILLVFGNDGYDLVSDYHTSLDEFIAPVEELAEPVVFLLWGRP